MVEVTENVILPKEGERNVLITSALPYVNNRPHLGNLIGSILSADVFARYSRRRGWNTLFVSGTDEYGTATETKARKEGKTPREVCDDFHAQHAETYKWFGCEFDHFGRTSTPEQTKVTQEIFLDLHRQGFIFEDELHQLYCTKDDMFLADRFAEGTCPDCGDEGARGDQCDACGHLINAVELVDPRCSVCNSTPEVRSSRHLFLDLKKLAPKIEEWLAQKGDHWSKNCIATTHAWMDQGLEPRCITRDLTWGVPVPLPGWESKVFYVWFDAPIGYISITSRYTDEWKQWWQNENVELFQFMGKDNIPFHTVMFPGCLLGSGQPWTMLKNVSTTSYLNYEGGKFSKSRNQGIFGADCANEGLPPHVWRYYLLATRPEDADADFSWEDFVAKNNTQLLANLGNFVYRALKVTNDFFDSKVPNRGELTDKDKAFIAGLEKRIGQYIQRMDNLQLRAGLGTAMAASKLANKYWDEQMPWRVFKDGDITRAATIVHVALNATYLLATLVEPFIPSFSQGLLKQLNLPLGILEGKTFQFGAPAGTTLEKAETLVPNIEGTRIEQWWASYGSTKLTTATFEWKIGQILEGKVHPKGGKRFVFQVDVGEKQNRQIIARIEDIYTIEEVIGKKVVVFCNLKAAKFGGVKSEGMIMGARSEDKYVLLQPDETSGIAPCGARVLPEGWICRPTPNVKKITDVFVLKEDGVKWVHEKRTASFKKQPIKNPKGEGKNKAAPQVATEQAPKTELLTVVVHLRGGQTLPIIAPGIEGEAKIE